MDNRIIVRKKIGDLIAADQTGRADDFIGYAEIPNPQSDAVGKVAKLESDGMINPKFVARYFGDGSDGNVTISTPTTLTRDMYYDTLTVNDTLTTNGFIIYCRTEIKGTGTVKYPDGNAGAVGGNAPASGSVSGGAGGAAITTGRLRNIKGGDGAGMTAGAGCNTGANSAAGTSDTSALGVIGAVGGAGADGACYSGSGTKGSGGAAGTASVFRNPLRFLELAMLGVDQILNGTLIHYAGSAGSSGGGTGGGGSDQGGHYPPGGGGGGAGASGGIVMICAKLWSGTFTIRAVGGAGNNGGTGNAGSGGYYSGGAGGGAGGSGGVALIIFSKKTWTGSYTLTGGAGGTGGSGGAGGSTGATGTTGTHIELEVGA